MKDLIPSAAIEKHIAFLGATGSGKTSAAKRGLVEPALAAGHRVCILDPTGAWWGLRLKADGKGKGFTIYIFGGDHADYPLRARDAVVLAETFATSSDSAIFDMSLMTVSDRTSFFTEFAEAIRRKNKGPLHLVIDEAHLFMPQAGAASGGAVPAMLHAGNNLVSLGRSRGLRIAMISQRPAKLHKDSLTQAQSLVAMRLMAPQDRKAIADWIADQADPQKGREIIASLPSLKPGEAWVWSPQDDMLRHVRFPMPATFDSSRAPDIGDGKGPELAPVNLDALKGRLTALEADAKANDPRALKAEVARLTKELSGLGPDLTAIQNGYERGLAEGLAKGENRAKAALTATAGCLRDALAVADGALGDLDIPMPVPAPAMIPKRAISMPEAIRRFPNQTSNAAAKRDMGNGTIPKGERACLIAAAQHPNGVTRQQLTVLTGYKRSSRDAYIQRLKERGYLSFARSDRIEASAEGMAALGDDFNPLPTGAALRDHVLRTLPEGERKILENLIQFYPESVTRSDLDTMTEYKRSSRDAYLQRLSARELVELTSGRATASANLFD